MEELLEQTQAYLTYIKEHYEAVQKAWLLIKTKCAHMPFVSNLAVREELDFQVLYHDASKLDLEEFTAYRRKFYPTEFEKSTPGILETIHRDFEAAWTNHKEQNFHHWQMWTTHLKISPPDQHINCIHMVIDWVGMAIQRGNPLDQYYRQNKAEIHIPEWARVQVEDIFKCLGALEVKCPKCGAETSMGESGRFCTNAGGFVNGPIGDYEASACGWIEGDE
jgi:hypothetical protein